MPSFCSASTLNTQQPMREGFLRWLTHGLIRSFQGWNILVFLLHIQFATRNQVSTWACVLYDCIVTVCRFFLRWSSGPGEEAKLFLWWHKALNLSAEQLQPQSGQTEVSGVVMGLQRLGTRLLQLGEERQNSGLLGAIGLGKRSPLSNRYSHLDWSGTLTPHRWKWQMNHSLMFVI